MMTYAPSMALFASLLTTQTPHPSGTNRLECLLSSESPNCTQEICASWAQLHRGKAVRLSLNLKESTADLNGIPGTIHHTRGQAVVHWRPRILGAHAVVRNEVQGRTVITLYDKDYAATFTCS
jgi:hypothetical protein